MSDCERAVDAVRRLDRRAKVETGLSSIPSADEEVQSKLLTTCLYMLRFCKFKNIIQDKFSSLCVTS